MYVSFFTMIPPNSYLLQLEPNPRGFGQIPKFSSYETHANYAVIL